MAGAETVLEVVNRALAKLGEARLATLEEGAPVAILLRDLIPGVRRHLLRAHPWGFAIVRGHLSADAEAPAWGFSLAYTLPAACLRLLEVRGVPATPAAWGDGRPPFAVEGGKILTDLAAPLPVRYVADAPDAGAWDASFAEVVACRLAREACERVTQSATRKADLGREYMLALKDARRSNAIERPAYGLPEADPWFAARFEGAGGAGSGVVASTPLGYG